MSNQGQGNKKYQFKDLKKRAIDIGSVPSLSVLPNSIDVIDFAKARIAEINVLKKDIQDAKYRGSRRVFQTLPKSMRRRAASFNLKRLPTRLRMKAVQELEKDPASAQKKPTKPSCRRRKRRTRNIQEMSQKRQGNKRWLETHIWHAKRSKMVDIWGLRLCLRPNEKCLRSSFEASKTGVTLHDASYHSVIQLEGEHAICEQMLKDMACIDEPESHFTFQLFDSTTLRLICPVRVVTHVQGDTKFAWLIVHPSASNQACADLEKRAAIYGLTISDLTGQLNIFEFSGERTLRTLQTVIRPVAGSLESLDSVNYILAEDPRFSFPPKGILEEQSSLDTGFIFEQSIWNGEYRKQSVQIRKTDKELDDLRAKNVVPGSPLVPKPEDAKVPIMIVPFDCPLLLLPKDWARPFWRSFIFAKVKFTGLEHSRHNQAELGLPVFPYDYPGTEAYEEYADRTAQDLEAEYMKRPAGKRINYEVMQVASPFKPAFDPSCWLIPTKVLDNLVHSHHLPLPLDPQKALIMGQIICTGKGSPEFNSIIYDERGENLVGYMTAGFFSLEKGRGTGIGCCYANIIAPALKADRGIAHQVIPVLVRNTNSLHKRPATFTVIPLSVTL